ncbi:MAG: Rieske 2Fe-2S domain-containing protein [Alphaproteobacteria bacterium]
MLEFKVTGNMRKSLRVVGKSRYFLYPDPQRPMVLNAKCPHRGGPLHLGTFDCANHSITCPWHRIKYKQKQLERSSMPAVRVGSTIRAFVPDEDGMSASYIIS